LTPIGVVEVDVRGTIGVGVRLIERRRAGANERVVGGGGVRST
jgi:hypothetical protein